MPRVYPTLTKSDNKSLMDAINQISRIRQDEIIDRDNLPQIFMSGRKVGKIPSGSTNTAATDRIGDFNYDSGHLYIAMSPSSTAFDTLTWVRGSLSTW